jgi:signal transduction histidine kinase/DNA-binding response OmpR family regulator
MSAIDRISAHAGENILVVEDSPTQAEKLRYILEKHRYRVAVATNGSAALAKIAGEKPSLVISDILMPEMDGYELCKRIKATEGLRDIPVILLTSLIDPQDVIRGLACGADNFISKPYNEEHLMSRVMDMLENRLLEQEPNEFPGLEINFACQKYLITSGRRQILDLLLSTYEAAIQKNSELIRARDELHGINEQLEQRVFERTAELAKSVYTLKVEIEERKTVEKELLRLNRLYATLSATNHAIAHINNRDTLFGEICRVSVEQGGFLLAWIGLLDGRTGHVNVAAAHGVTGYLDGLDISLAEDPSGKGPTASAIRQGSIYICNDFLNDTSTRPWHEKAHAYGLRASASETLRLKGEVIGALNLYAGEKDFFDPSQVELLKQMATDICLAIDTLDNETRRRKAEQLLKEETNERLKAVETLREKEHMLIQQSRQAAMGEMIGNIAHQWRQPLNALGLTVQGLLLFYDLDKFNREFLEQGVSTSMELIRHMSRTIDDFRNYFRPDKEKGEFKVAEAVENTLSLIESSFKNQLIDIEVIAKDDPVIYGYRNEFAQALLNILNNARDALTERNTGDPRMKITICSENDRAVVTVADNAGGISEEIMDKIFDPYFTTKGPQAGTGVGLFMSKTIIEKNMGGRLIACNIANGAEFRIEV